MGRRRIVIVLTKLQELVFSTSIGRVETLSQSNSPDPCAQDENK